MMSPCKKLVKCCSRILEFLSFSTNLVFLRAKLGGQRLAEIFRREDLADLDFAIFFVRIRAALHPLDRFLPRLALPQPEPRDQLLGLGKRAVRHGALAA